MGPRGKKRCNTASLPDSSSAFLPPASGPGRLWGRLRGQGRAHLDDPLLTDGHRARFGALGFGDVARFGAAYRYRAAVTGLAVKSGDGRSAAHRLPVRLLTGAGTQDYMAARHSTHVKPEVVGAGHLQAKSIVVRIRAAGQYFPASGKFIAQNSQPGGRGTLLVDRVDHDIIPLTPWRAFFIFTIA